MMNVWKRSTRQIKKCVIPVILLTVSHTAIANIATHAKPYVTLGGGYGTFIGASDGTGQTGFMRMGLGSEWAVHPHFSVGGELGVQSGHRIKVYLPNPSSSVQLPPAYITITSPIDVLLTAKYHFTAPFFVQIKAGGVYYRTQVDTIDARGVQQWRPDLQAGVGMDLTQKVHLSLNYQRFFGHNPSVQILESGTARLTQVPSWQAAFLSVQMDI